MSRKEQTEMKLGFKRGEKGFTLIEIIIVLAVLGVLAAVVVPNVSGFLGRGKERGWNSDRDTLQAAVDSYRTDVAHRAAAGNPWPTLGGLIGAPWDSGNGTYVQTLNTSTANYTDGDYTDVGERDIYLETGEDRNSFIDIGALITDKYLKSANAVKSADRRLNNTATNSPSGSYGWFIDANGNVDAIYWVDLNNGHTAGTSVNATDVQAAEVSSTLGYQTDIYP